jgi:hypothetical protein
MTWNVFMGSWERIYTLMNKQFIVGKNLQFHYRIRVGVTLCELNCLHINLRDFT